VRAELKGLAEEVARIRGVPTEAPAEVPTVPETAGTEAAAPEAAALEEPLGAAAPAEAPAELAVAAVPEEPQDLLLVDTPAIEPTGCCTYTPPEKSLVDLPVPDPPKCEPRVSGAEPPKRELACPVGKTQRIAQRRLPAALPMSVVFDAPHDIGKCCVDSVFFDNEPTGATATDEMATAVIHDLQAFLTRHVKAALPVPAPLVAPLAA